MGRLRKLTGIVFCILFAATGSSQVVEELSEWSRPAGLPAGHVDANGRTFLSASLGVDQYENGKPSKTRRQQWFLTCSSNHDAAPRGGSPERRSDPLDCKLERITFDYFGRLGTLVNSTEYSSRDGSLTFTRFRLDEGLLDFDIHHVDDSVTQVFTKLARRKYQFYLVEFSARNTSRSSFTGEVQTVEYRVPTYTRTEPVQVVFSGFRSSSSAEWDQLAESLQPNDRAIFQRLKRDEEVGAIFVEAMDSTKAAMAKEGSGPATTEEAKARRERLIATEYKLAEQVAFEKWLLRSGMSEKGRLRVLDFVRSREPATD